MANRNHNSVRNMLFMYEEIPEDAELDAEDMSRYCFLFSRACTWSLSTVAWAKNLSTSFFARETFAEASSACEETEDNNVCASFKYRNAAFFEARSSADKRLPSPLFAAS